VSIEDRVRAATRARTALIRDIRPLELPDELPARSRRGRRAGRWLTWGAPIGAAALVTALALVLVMLRQADGPQPRPATPSAVPPAVASVPRYYVALAYTGGTSSQMEAVVGDDQTGRKVAVIPPSAGQNFYGVTAAADDRTFVLMNAPVGRHETTWYLLRLTPGAAHPVQLTKLPIKPVVAVVDGLALSADGRELAVMWRTATTATNAVTYLSVYSMSSGAVLGTWRTHPPQDNFAFAGGNAEKLSWVNGDRGIDFEWTVRAPGAPESAKFSVRTLDVTVAGHDLLADSRLVMQVPAMVSVTSTTFTTPCATSLVAADGTIVCGSTGASDVSGAEGCTAAPPSFVSYKPATGKQLATAKPFKVLYRYPGQCLNGQSMVLWTDSTGSRAVAFLLLALKGKPASAGDSFGVVGGGHFTALPALVTGTGWASGASYSPGGIAF
jgi:hypothetical protein